MSNDRNALLEILPTEILYYIFDHLDAQTILLSIRNSCQRLRAAVNNYNRYILDFHSISKPDFHHICRLIDPQNVISLRLSNDDDTIGQVDLFISLFSLRQFNRLRSLTLIEIEEQHLTLILQHVNTASLTSFSFVTGTTIDRGANSITELVSSMFARTNLLKLELNILAVRLGKFTWPAQSTIQHLRLGLCISFLDICTVLRCLPHLRTFDIRSLSEPNSDETASVRLCTPSRQLNSLTLECSYTEINTIELLLSLMPLLNHLRLTGHETFLDGNRWENFIQTNLPLLKSFEFFFHIQQVHQDNFADVKSIIASYRTPFWLEYKKWFVTFEYVVEQPNDIHFYSVPICIPSLTYKLESNKMRFSTVPKLLDNEASMMDNITTVRLNVSKLMITNLEQQAQMNVSIVYQKRRYLQSGLKYHASADEQ